MSSSKLPVAPSDPDSADLFLRSVLLGDVTRASFNGHEFARSSTYVCKSGGTGAFGDSDVTDGVICVRCYATGQTVNDVAARPCPSIEDDARSR